MIHAAVRVAANARIAMLAVNVWLDTATVARLHVGHTGADVNDFDAEFVTGNSRVTEERHLAEEARIIGAANPDAVNANDGITLARHRRFGDIDHPKRAGAFE